MLLDPPEPANDCAADAGLVSVDAAFVEIVSRAVPVGGIEGLPVGSALGRVTAASVGTPTPLPRFDHSAVDGYGVAAADLGRAPPFRLRVAEEVRAGRPAAALRSGEAIRLFTGAPVSADVAGVVVEERCLRLGSSVELRVAVKAGANIRRSGEDVAAGEAIVEAGTVLDARHIAILVAAGVTTVPVRRRVRVAVLSNGNELAADGAAAVAGHIPDANRPMLMALLTRPFVEVVDAGCHLDDPAALARAFATAAEGADLVLSSGGVAGSEADHVAKAVAAAGGAMRRLRLALKPGKPILAGRIGDVPILGLPGNPVAAMVNFLLFGRPLVGRVAGCHAARPPGELAVAAETFPHARGRTEFMPAALVASPDGGRRLLKLGRGGSARLRPVVLADGLAEIAAEAGDVAAGEELRFHPFAAAFAP